MKMTLLGYAHVTPKHKAPFTFLYTKYNKYDVTGEVAEAIYIQDGFPLPTLTVGMTIDVDRDGGGFLIEVSEAKPLNMKINS